MVETSEEFCGSWTAHLTAHSVRRDYIFSNSVHTLTCVCVLKTLNIDAFLICSSWCGTLKRQSRSLVSALRRFESYVTRMTNWPLTFWASSFFSYCKAWRELAWTRLMAETSVSIDFSRFVSLPSFSCLYLFAVAHLDIHYIFFCRWDGGFPHSEPVDRKRKPKT